MNDAQREQIRSNAKYLRCVRPIDPEEIYEYVEGAPHPAAVRQVVREMAGDLGLVEREDGTFVPATDDPVEVAFEGVEALPDRHHDQLTALLTGEFGPDWHTGESGDRLRERIREVKAQYLSGGSVDYDRLTALGYAIYHLPAYYATSQYLLAGLVADDRLPGTLRVLDVGAGVGGPALGLFDLLPAETLVEYHAVEPSAAADVLDSLLDGAGRNVHPTIHRETAESVDVDAIAGDGGFDLVLMANVLSELEDPTGVARDCLDALATDGSLLAVAPADRNTAIGLREVERALADDGPATVYAPTLRLWSGMGPEGECWSFDVKPDLAVPSVQRRLDDAATHTDDDRGEFLNVDVQYAYSLLRRDGERAVDVRADRGRYARMADAEDHVTDRVNLLAVKLSHDLADDGHPLFLVCDGSERVDHFAVRTDDSSLTTDLEAADYGAVLQFENALVLWNDDEGAYNVVIDDEAVVESVAG